MDRRIRKLVISIFCIFACVISFNTLMAEEESGFVIQIDITEKDDEFIVDIVDDPYYANNKPYIYVITDYAKAYVYDDNQKLYNCTVSDGEVSFQVTKGQRYYVTDTLPEFAKSSSSSKSGYTSPKTCVD